MQQNENNILIYQDDNGITKVNVRFSDEDVWLTQAQLAEIYDTTQENISMHIKNIYKDAEFQAFPPRNPPVCPSPTPRLLYPKIWG